MSERRSLFFRLWPLLALQNGLLAALVFHLSPGLSAAMMAALAAGVIVFSMATAMMATRIADAVDTSADGGSAHAQASASDGSPNRKIALQRQEPSTATVLELVDLQRDRPVQVIPDVDGPGYPQSTRLALDALDAGLRRLASADLTVRLETEFPEEFEGMRADFNRAMTQLDDSVSAIAQSTDRLHGEWAEARYQLNQKRITAVDDTPVLTAARDGLNDTSAALRNQAAGLLHVSAIAGGAAERLEKQQEAAKVADTALAELAGSDGKMKTVASAMRDIAFRTNILSVNASVTAANASPTQEALKTFALELRNLAEGVAEVAKEASTLEWNITRSADQVRSSIDRLAREGHQVSLGIETIESRLASISDTLDSSAAMSERTAAVLTEVTSSGSRRSSADKELDDTIDRVTHELALINQHCGRFMKVTVIQESPPPEDRPPRQRNHLRLVKT